MSQISKRVREAVRLRLADPTTGFNANISAIAEDYGIQAFQIDWSPTSKNFFEADLDPGDIDESSPSRYPLVMLHALSANNTHDAMPRAFSGEVGLQLWFHVTTRQTPPRVLERTLDAIESSVFGVFADGNWPQAWGAADAIHVGVSADRSRIESGGESWRQSIKFSLTFKLDTN